MEKKESNQDNTVSKLNKEINEMPMTKGYGRGRSEVFAP